mmetsp:Transcript_38072/g.84795  ORF Transcript_38072/g.84795 Transcript_38072/m.84795 type:complete len:235 (+) Transcript_38072:61-765(+)
MALMNSVHAKGVRPLTAPVTPCRVTRSFRTSGFKPQQQRAASVIVRGIRQYPDPEFIAETKSKFPEDGVATVEQARCLFSALGYAYLDVRPALEYEEAGKVVGSVNIPFMNSKRVWNAKEGKKVIEKAANPDFIKTVQKRFPKKDQPLLVACSDGRSYSIDALEALDGAGYTNIVGLKGGYYAWFRVFDNKLNRRRADNYTEDYSKDGDSCGIHSTGAGFERMDPKDMWVPPKY